jgi:hypothetical protein
MKPNYKIIHSVFNNPEMLLVANFKWINEIIFYRCEFCDMQSIIGKWNIKYK